MVSHDSTWCVQAEQARARLDVLKQQLLKRKDLLRHLVAEKQQKFQAKKAQLNENNVHVSCGSCPTSRLWPLPL